MLSSDDIIHYVVLTSTLKKKQDKEMFRALNNEQDFHLRCDDILSHKQPSINIKKQSIRHYWNEKDSYVRAFLFFLLYCTDILGQKREN